jgi:hypothetical protein
VSTVTVGATRLTETLEATLESRATSSDFGPTRPRYAPSILGFEASMSSRRRLGSSMAGMNHAPVSRHRVGYQSHYRRTVEGTI